MPATKYQSGGTRITHHMVNRNQATGSPPDRITPGSPPDSITPETAVKTGCTMPGARQNSTAAAVLYKHGEKEGL